MSLTSQDLQRLAKLSRLSVPEADEARMLEPINGLFHLVEQMQAVDTQGVVPLAHPFDVVQAMALRLRQDQVSEPNAREANQQSAPWVEDGLLVVPKVIE
jgi:aspartyl-tRNA(Asn)/glutamyl-tRNA(Gln) amidotransferase subunit C